MNTKVSFVESIKAGAFAAGVAAVVNIVLFFIGQATGIFTDDIQVQPGQPLSIAPVAMSSIVPTIIASIVFFFIEKYTANGFGNFRILAAILLVLSFINPFALIPGVTIAYGVLLNVMHVVVVAALLYFLGQASKR